MDAMQEREIERERTCMSVMLLTICSRLLTRSNLCDDVDHLMLCDVAAVAGPEVLQQAAVLHQLCDDVDGLHQCADGIELEQVGVVDLLHHLGLCNKVLHLHSACRKYIAFMYSLGE